MAHSNVNKEKTRKIVPVARNAMQENSPATMETDVSCMPRNVMEMKIAAMEAMK